MIHMREKLNIQKLHINSLNNDEKYEQQECCKKFLERILIVI